MNMVVKYNSENSLTIQTHRVLPLAVSFRNVLAFAWSAQLKIMK